MSEAGGLSRQGSRVSRPGSRPPSRTASVVGTPAAAPLDSEVSTHGQGYCKEAAKIVQRYTDDHERVKRVALGDVYDAVKLDDKMLADTYEEFRQAKLYKQLRLHDLTRSVELEERLRLLGVEEKVLSEERLRLGTLAEQLMRRARRKFAKEAEAARWLEQQKYESDMKFIVDSERERLVRKRRAFEVQSNAGGDTLDRGVPSPRGHHPDADVVLLMTVAIGRGHDEILTVREGDDYQEVASRFAALHKLPSQVVPPLVDEIRKHARRPSSEPAPLHAYHAPIDTTYRSERRPFSTDPSITNSMRDLDRDRVFERR
eukprot:TRINITY_DN27156_c0_g1_i1.p1 TRINITY_DN27156_c0_g1~~TRINITY_DN27156_c0_g1_i1.p1  ORF type:complete len:316 (+),score=108.52 TRINITY_DN27156_c0_g1_i1:3-950(+)